MAIGCMWLVLVLSASVNGMGLRPSGRNGTSSTLDQEDEDLLVRILSVEASNFGSLVQSSRKFLQKVREWHGTHPAESVLANCILNYWVEVKIPEIVAAADEEIYEGGRRGLSTPVWIEQHPPEGEPQPLPNFQDSTAVQGVFKRILDNDVSLREVTRTHPSLSSLNGDGNLKFKRKAVKTLYLLYAELRDLLFEFKLIGCSFHYLMAKFWEWIDSAP